MYHAMFACFLQTLFAILNLVASCFKFLQPKAWSRVLKICWATYIQMVTYVTRHEKIELMCTKYTPLHYSTSLTFCVRYTSSVNFIIFSITCYSTCKSFIDKLFLRTKLWNFEIQKGGQILCAHKPYFLMLGHIWFYTL